jgi:hypothetical protein
MGPGSAGVVSVFASLAHPDVFQQAAIQSYYPIEPIHERLPELMGASGKKPELIYMVWSRNDYDLGEGRQAEKASRELFDQLQAAGRCFRWPRQSSSIAGGLTGVTMGRILS